MTPIHLHTPRVAQAGPKVERAGHMNTAPLSLQQVPLST